MYYRVKKLALIVCVSIEAATCSLPANKNTAATKEPVAWEKIGPGGGGATFIPTFSLNNPEKFIVRCDMTGSYLTTNGGESYDQINYANGAGAYAYDPKDSNIVYIGSATLNRSADGGKTWQQLFPKKEEIKAGKYKGDHANYSIETVQGSLYENGGITNIRIDPLTAGAIYFSIGNAFFYSGDAGSTWRKEYMSSPVDFIYTGNNKENHEVFIFTTGDINIFHPSSGMFDKKTLPAAMVPAFSFTGGTIAANGNTVFYALHQDSQEMVNGEPGPGSVWISKDNGKEWKRLTDSVTSNHSSADKPSFSMIRCAEEDAAKTYLVCNRYAEKKDGQAVVYWYGAMRTTDAGKSWNWVWKGGGGSGQYGVKDGKGVANLKDAWVEKAFGGEYIRLIDVGVYPANGDIAIVTDWYRTMKTTDGGLTWKEIYSKQQPDGSFSSRGVDVTTTYNVHFDPLDSTHIAVSYTDIGYHHSYNSGKSWFRSADGVPVAWINTCYDVVFDPDIKGKLWSAWSGMHDIPRGKMTRNPNWKERAKGGICLSEDGGKTWKPVDTSGIFNGPVTSIVLDPSSKPGNRTLYAAVYNKGVIKSTDDGKTWTLNNKGIGENTCAFELTLTGNGSLFLTVSPVPEYKDGKKGRSFYAGAVYRSTDAAATWTKLDVSKGLIFPNGLDYDRANPDNLYLACWSDIDLADLTGGAVAKATGGNEVLKTPGGIFKSGDGGNTWTSVFDSAQYVYDVTVDPYHPGRLYNNTFNRAAYRSDDYGKTWRKIKGYDFHWGHRIVIDQWDHEKVYITSFGSSVWHGVPVVE